MFLKRVYHDFFCQEDQAFPPPLFLMQFAFGQAVVLSPDIWDLCHKAESWSYLGSVTE